MKHYQTDEFLFGGVSDTKPNAVDKKVSLLYDFCVLTKKDTDKEDAVRTLLEQCSDEYEMSRVLHNVLCGDMHIDELLIERGVM